MAPVLEGRPGGWRICIGVLAVLVLAALALTNPAKGSASAIPSQAGEWIVLDSGQFGNQVWSVRAMHESAGSSSRSNEDRESCIWIGAERQLGKYNFHRSSFRRCDSLPARSAVGAAPLVASGVFTGTGTGQDLTAVGMIFPAAVRRARVTESDGSSTEIRTESFDTEEARSAGLDDYRYAVFSVRGPWCASSLASISRTGRTLWSGAVDAPC